MEITTNQTPKIVTKKPSHVSPAVDSQDAQPVSVEPGPPSLLIVEGHTASLECHWRLGKTENPPDVTWKKSCSPNCSTSTNVSSTSNREISMKETVSKLTFHRAEKKDTGMYYCSVQTRLGQDHSCGTYLWVRSEWAYFVPMGDSLIHVREWYWGIFKEIIES